MYGLMLACFLDLGIVPRWLATRGAGCESQILHLAPRYQRASRWCPTIPIVWGDDFPPLHASDINKHITLHHLQPHLIVEHEVGAHGPLRASSRNSSNVVDIPTA